MAPSGPWRSEAKFYFIVAILAPALRRGSVLPLLATVAALTILGLGASPLSDWLTSGAPLFRLLYALTLSGQMICFIIGIVFDLVHRWRSTLDLALCQQPCGVHVGVRYRFAAPAGGAADPGDGLRLQAALSGGAGAS